MDRSEMLAELSIMLEIGKRGMSPLTKEQQNAIKIARRMLLHPQDVVCGSCTHFSDETTDGTGLCMGETPTMCYGSHAMFCSDFQFRTDSEH